MLMLAVVVGSSAEEATIQRGGTLTLAQSTDLSLRNFDPTTATYPPADDFILNQIFESLLTLDENGKIVPLLATEWEWTDDDLGLIVKLRDDVVYSDGTKFNAEACAYVMNYYVSEACPHVNKAKDMGALQSFDVLGEYTIRINLSKKDPDLIGTLCGRSFAMMSPANVDNKDCGTNPIGTGPFKLAEYVEGDHILLTANENYYQLGEDGLPLPYLDAVEYRIITDESVSMASLASNEIDGIDIVGAITNQFKVISMEDTELYQTNSINCMYVSFNFDKELISNDFVRQALSYAIDRQEICDVVFEGTAVGVPFYSAPGQWWYYDADVVEYDPVKARELLAEGGYPDGIELELCSISREPDNSIVQLMQAQMAEAGITLDLNIMERTAWITYTKGGGHTMCIGKSGNWGTVSLPRMLADPCVTYIKGSDERVVRLQELYNSLKTTMGDDARYEIVKQLQAQYNDNVMGLVLCKKGNYCAFKRNVHGIIFNGNSAFDFTRVWKE